MSERRKILELFDNQKEQTEKRVSEGIEKYRKGDMKFALWQMKCTFGALWCQAEPDDWKHLIHR